MATLNVLRTAYSDVARINYTQIPAADLARLQALAQQVDASALTLTDARAEIGKLVVGTTSIATLSYAFFTGATPLARGFDYLVSPTGGNANNLNSAYYSAFSTENRAINFAVNLGKNGEGAARFAAAYGALDLTAAATKAYAEIFGFAPAAGKISEILDSQVSDGRGGVFTRAEYFAAYGHDGLSGTGTKAAMIGWLLAEAAKADLGVYAKANDAFLADLAADGQANFNVDLLGVYGVQPTYPAGAVIAVAPSQSVAPDAASPALRSTTGNDTVTGTDLLSGQTIATADGHDTITLSGALGGYIDAGAGNDTITMAVLSASVPVLGGAINGTVSGGAGNDLITIGKVVDGGVIDGGAGDDTAVIGLDSEFYTQTKITNVEHLVISSATITYGGFDVSGFTGLRDITTRSSKSLTLNDIADRVALKMDGVSGGTLVANYHTSLVFNGPTSQQVGAQSAEVHLAGVTSSAATPTHLRVTGDDGVLTLNVQTDSVLSSIVGGASIVVKGNGRLTAGFNSHAAGFEINTYALDASASAGIDITEIGADAPDGRTTVVVLSSVNDSVAAELRGQSSSIYTLGGGADVFKLFQDGFAAPRFSNLSIDGGKVATLSTITDFAKGVDRVDLGSVIPTVTTGLSAGSATTLEQALINISGGVAANGTGIFEFGGDTYIYHQDATVGVNSGDGLIRLVGVTGLAVGTGATVADIHYG